MDIYEFKELGHSGFDNCRIVDADSYSSPCENDGVLFVGNVDDAPDCLDNCEITSIDVYFNPKTNQLEATIDVDGVDPDVYLELFGEGDCTDPEVGLATDDRAAGQWLE